MSSLRLGPVRQRAADAARLVEALLRVDEPHRAEARIHAAQEAIQALARELETGGWPLEARGVETIAKALDDASRAKDVPRLQRFAVRLGQMALKFKDAPPAADAQSPTAVITDAGMLERAFQASVGVLPPGPPGTMAFHAIVHQHGVEDYDRVVNAGYRGLYGMSVAELERKKGLAENERLVERMNRSERAANYFRLALTELRIKEHAVYGQAALEEAAELVGSTVRAAILKNGGPPPEDVPLDPNRSSRKQ